MSPRCALKVDLRKAFDSIHWNFVFNIMIALNFPEEFICWIQVCITSPWFSIIVNGGLEGYFKGEKGIRQGDPLSPYIFVLVMNVLSSMLDIAAANGIVRYHPKCKRISLTHLCFADNLLIFLKGDLHLVIGVQ